MIEMFKRARKVFIIVAVPYVFLMFALTYRIDYRITTPGDTSQIGDYVELMAEEYPQENPVASIYVMGLDRVTFFQFITSTFDHRHDINQLPESRQHVSDSANFRSGQVARNTSIDASFITSLEALGMDIEYEEQRIVNLIYTYARGDIDIGDIILEVNGNPEIDEALTEAECGEHTFTIKREDEVKDITQERFERDDSCVFGFSMRTYYNITDAPIPLEVRGSLVGGPSGGLMQTLHIYNALSEDDLTRDIRITGTGTINIDGTTGSVGGVRQKVFTAERKGYDVFFVPMREGATNDNYAQAVRAIDEIGDSDLTIIGVEHFTDALDWLLRYHGGVIE